MSDFLERPALPLEICELCIDALADTAEDDELSRAALAQCLRVSHVFWIRARRHVFSHVRIQITSPERTFELVEKRLLALLALMTSDDGAEVPFSITTLIKSFTLDVALAYDFQPEKTMNLPSVEAVLKEFLKAEVLHSLSILTHELLWNQINPATQILIHRLCRAPHFKALSLPGIWCIPTQFWEGTTVRDLTLRNVRLGIPLSPSKQCTDIDTLLSPPDLDSLKVIGFVCDLQASFQSSSCSNAGLPFSRLEKLMSVIRNEKNLQAMRVITARSHCSLHTLHLCFNADTLPYFDIALCDLNHPPNLCHLKLSISWAWYSGMVSTIRRLCLLIPQESTLKFLAIEINVGNMDECSKALDMTPWQILEKSLIQSRVPQMELVIKLPPRQKSNEADIFIDAGLFAELRGDKSIDFTFQRVHSNTVFGTTAIQDYYH